MQLHTIEPTVLYGSNLINMQAQGRPAVRGCFCHKQIVKLIYLIIRCVIDHTELHLPQNTSYMMDLNGSINAQELRLFSVLEAENSEEKAMTTPER